MVATINKRAAKLRSIRGLARVEAYKEGQRVRLRQVLVAERPARLRIETLSPFDQPIAYLATDGRELSVYDLGSQRYMTGQASAENVARLFPIRLAPAKMVDLLLGGLPLPPGKRSLKWNGNEGVYELTVQDENGREISRIALRAPDLVPTSISGQLSDGAPFTIQLDKYSVELGVPLPGRVRFATPRDAIHVSLRWDGRELNADIPAEAWKIPVPRGVVVQGLPRSPPPQQ